MLIFMVLDHLIRHLQMKEEEQLKAVIRAEYLMFPMDTMLYYLLVQGHFLLAFEEHLFKVNYLQT